MVSAQQEASPPHPLQILVVDADVSMRELMKLHLGNAGYAAVVAEDAVVAGRTLLRWMRPVLVLAAQLPCLSGSASSATLVADATIPAVPIILMSAHEHFADKADALGLSFLLKPFTKAELLEAISSSTSRSGRTQAAFRPPRPEGVARAVVHFRAALARP